MKSLFIYLTLIGATIFSVYGGLTMNIATDEQIVMVLFGCMFFGLLTAVFAHDVQQYLKKRKLKPQRF
jgi:hypothetical protein